MKKNILITDILFPTAFAKWRIEDIKSFVDRYDTDILVLKKTADHENIIFEVDYEIMKNYYNLDEYNILIFNPEYNFLNRYNSRIDGTQFNCEFIGDYVFTKKTTFDISNYDLVYHIFLNNYLIFNKVYSFPEEKQVVRAYPGGGLWNPNEVRYLSKECHTISTHRLTTTALRDLQYTNYIEVLGGPMLQNNAVIKQKVINNGKLTVCFSSVGAPLEKGEENYVNIVNKYLELYPKDNIEFITIGNSKPYQNITKYNIMRQSALDEMYSSKVDIILNLETGAAFNGWPLGVEALLQGVILITTDNLKSNDVFKFPDESIFIVHNNDIIEKSVEYIKSLYEDRIKLNSMSKVSQSFVLEKYSYANQQEKVFNFIEEIYQKHSI